MQIIHQDYSSSKLGLLTNYLLSSKGTRNLSLFKFILFSIPASKIFHFNSRPILPINAACMNFI